MSKSKHAPALFELISKPQRGDELRLRSTASTPAPALETPLAAVPKEPAPALVFVPEPASHGPPAEAESTAADGRWWRIAGGRIRFSLSQRGATIALSVAGLVLIFVHYLGYSLGERRGRESALAGQPAAVQEIEEARNGPVSRRLFEGVGEDPTSVATAALPAATPAVAGPTVPVAPSEAVARTGWVKGNTYIVVQDFGKDARGDAEKAREYLVQNGVPAVVLERSGSYPHRLITARGFDRDDQGQKRQADEYQERVRRLGQAYLQAGGRYDFKTAYFIKLTGETW